MSLPQVLVVEREPAVNVSQTYYVEYLVECLSSVGTKVSAGSPQGCPAPTRQFDHATTDENQANI